MIRWTTPTLRLSVEGVDLTMADEVLVSVTQRYARLERTADSIAYEQPSTLITVSFSQQETAQLAEGQAEVQVNWRTGSIRGATDVGALRVGRQLHEKVME